MTKLALFIEGVEVDLFKDEIVTVNSSVANVQDISKVFSDFSQSFLVPASPRNNAIFEHWYESDVIPTIDQNLRRDAFIEIETQPFRTGKIQMNEAVIKNGQVVSYSLNFFGALTSLKDRFAEFTLKDLDYSTIAHTYSGTEVYNRVTDGTTAYNVRYPLIAPRRVWTFGDASANDITTNTGSVKWFELFPAIRADKIFEIIGTQFGITFNGSFFNSARWTDLYIRYQNVEQFVFLTNYELIDYNSTTPSNTFFNTIDNTLTYSYVPIAGLTFHETTLSFSSVSDGTATIYCEGYVNGVLYATYESYGGTNPLILTKEANIPGLNSVVTYQFKADKTVNFDVDVLYQDPSGNIYTGFGNTINLTSTLNASVLAPNLKIVDFVSAIFKAFNLVCVGENETTFTIEPLQDWYSLGKEFDITTDVINSSGIKKVPLYKQIAFKYKESKSFINKNFSALFNRQYGDLDYSFNYDGTEFKIELPFENIQFAELETSNLFCTFLIEENQSAYVPEPLLLYLGGEETATTFKFFDGSSYLNVTDYALFNSVNTTGFSLCFGNEFNIVTQETEPNSLYNTYYANHLGNLYNLQQRLFSFTAYLPTGLISALRLNDKLIIKDKRYLINDISTTLNNGEVKMNLLLDLEPIVPCSECFIVKFILDEIEYSVEVNLAGQENGFNYYTGVDGENTFTIGWENGNWILSVDDGESEIALANVESFDSCIPFNAVWDKVELLTDLDIAPCFVFDCDECVNIAFDITVEEETTNYNFEMIWDGTRFNGADNDEFFRLIFEDGQWNLYSSNDNITFDLVATASEECDCPQGCESWTIAEFYEEILTNFTSTSCE
jgi:hypothetical protein